MDRRFAHRMEQLLKDATVDRTVLREMLPRLEKFVQPFAACLQTPEQQARTQQYIAGLVSKLDKKNAESIAYLHDMNRQALQIFIGQAPWDHQPMVKELVRQVGKELGKPKGVLVFDPSGFAKKGTESVGVQRQWCGRLGKLENCQVGVYLGYVSEVGHALVDFRLYLPAEWARDKARRKKCGVPAEVRFQTRHELALEMLREQSSLLPHDWVTGDDEMGHCTWFRRALRDLNERYLLAVPSNTVIRDIAAEPPPYSGCGRHPKPPFLRADRWCAALPEDAWETIEVRPGDKGPLVVQAVKRRVLAKTERQSVDAEETLVVTRERQADGSIKHDYYLSSAPVETPLSEFVRVANDEHRIEECLKLAKSEAGLADYQVRTWEGWHHHQALSLLAAWFLTQETRRAKKKDTGDDGPPSPRGNRLAAA